MCLSKRRVVIFDFDGTIADTKASIISTATKVLTDWGIKKEELGRVGEIIGPPFPQAFEQVFGLSHADAVEITSRYRDIYNYLGVDAWPAFAGMGKLLADLQSAGRQLGVASSKRTPLVRKGLQDNGILERFATVRAKEDDAESTKVSAILQVLADVDAQRGEAVMVGDRFHDVEAAHACGIPCVGVLYGRTSDRRELVGAGAEAIAETMEDLREVLLGA